MTPRALAYPQCPKEVEADDPEAMTSDHQRGGDGIQAEDTTCLKKSNCLQKWSYNSASSVVPRRIVGALQLLPLTEREMTIGSYGKR